jgi:hypothetical protein
MRILCEEVECGRSAGSSCTRCVGLSGAIHPTGIDAADILWAIALLKDKINLDEDGISEQALKLAAQVAGDHIADVLLRTLPDTQAIRDCRVKCPVKSKTSAVTTTWDLRSLLPQPAVLQGLRLAISRRLDMIIAAEAEQSDCIRTGLGRATGAQSLDIVFHILQSEFFIDHTAASGDIKQCYNSIEPLRVALYLIILQAPIHVV